jgi:hypothetical protein
MQASRGVPAASFRQVLLRTVKLEFLAITSSGAPASCWSLRVPKLALGGGGNRLTGCPNSLPT